MNMQFRPASRPRPPASRPPSPIATSIRRVRPRTNCIRSWPSAGTSISRPTACQAYHGMMEGPPYPKAQPNASRRDAWPPEGGPQGSSLSFMQKQLLDPYNVALGVLNPLGQRAGPAQPGFRRARSAPRSTTGRSRNGPARIRRLKASVVVAYEDGAAAAAEIRKRAGDKDFAQVLLLSRTVEPLGQRRYWPIYEAADEIGLPVGIHAFGFGGYPITASRLAVLLHRGDGRPRAVPADRAGQHRARRRVRALSRN